MFYKHCDARPDWTNANWYRYPKNVTFSIHVHVFQVFLCSVAHGISAHFNRAVCYKQPVAVVRDMRSLFKTFSPDKREIEGCGSLFEDKACVSFAEIRHLFPDHLLT